MEKAKLSIKKTAPFLRWTGSKSWLIKKGIKKFIPKSYNTYHELFLGGGSLFFYLQPKPARISDINGELINTYTQIQENIEEVIINLKKLNNTKEDYYKIRGQKFQSQSGRAARFIYLNRTSFNGIYRVNLKGEYNVPYGYRNNVDIVTEENLRLVSQVLSGVIISNKDFYKAVEDVRENDFVYLDPPYTVAHQKNGFIEYNSKLFSWNDQEKLAEAATKISEKGAYFVLSNAEHESIRNLYKGLGEFHQLSRYSKVGGRNKTRGVFNEILIKNF